MSVVSTVPAVPLEATEALMALGKKEQAQRSLNLQLSMQKKRGASLHSPCRLHAGSCDYVCVCPPLHRDLVTQSWFVRGRYEDEN